LKRLKYFIAIGTENVSNEDRTYFEDHGLEVYTIGKVHEKGLESIQKGQ